MDQDVPELSKEPKDIEVVAPFAPLLRVLMQRGSSPPQYCSIKGAVPSGDAFCDLGHRRSAEVIWYIPNGQLESTVPLQVEPVLICELDERLPDSGMRERWVRHQGLNITVQNYGAVNLCLHPSVQYTSRLAL